MGLPGEKIDKLPVHQRHLPQQERDYPRKLRSQIRQLVVKSGYSWRSTCLNRSKIQDNEGFFR